VRDAEKKQELVRLCLNQPTAATAQELVVCVARLDTWKRNARLMLEKFAASEAKIPDPLRDYYQKIVPLVYNHGPLYVLGPLKKLVMNTMALTRPMPRSPAGKADMRVWAHKSTALGCENLMLSLRAFGLDSCPIEGMDGTRVRRLLGLPRAAEVCMVISAGKRADNGIYGPQIRMDASRFLFEV
jgi:nitroreductase